VRTVLVQSNEAPSTKRHGSEWEKAVLLLPLIAYQRSSIRRAVLSGIPPVVAVVFVCVAANVVATAAPQRGQYGAGCGLSSCKVTLVKVAQLSGAPVSALSGPSPSIVRAPDGGFLVFGEDRSHLLVFDASGSYRKSLGLPPDARLSALISANGSVLAYDVRNRVLRRVLADGTLDAGVPVPAEPESILPSGRVVITRNVPTSELIGHPFVVLSRSGEVVQRFGAEVPFYRADMRLAIERVLAPVNDNEWYAMPRGRYVVERWNRLRERLEESYTIKSDWFRGSDAPSGSLATRPASVVQAAWFRDGVLWSLTRDADLSWRASADGEQAWSRRLAGATYDWVLEAIDPRSGSAIASARFDLPIWGRSQGELLLYDETLSGDGSAMSVWRFSLNGRSK
jgi:hypothetical protein